MLFFILLVSVHLSRRENLFWEEVKEEVFRGDIDAVTRGKSRDAVGREKMDAVVRDKIWMLWFYLWLFCCL